jgi:hypothetical protein
LSLLKTNQKEAKLVFFSLLMASGFFSFVIKIKRLATRQVFVEKVCRSQCVRSKEKKTFHRRFFFVFLSLPLFLSFILSFIPLKFV